MHTPVHKLGATLRNNSSYLSFLLLPINEHPILNQKLLRLLPYYSLTVATGGMIIFRNDRILPVVWHLDWRLVLVDMWPYLNR